MNSDISIHIVEEPAPRGTKFRYVSECRSGPILGINSTSTKKTYPSIKILNYTGTARVLVYCVTKDEPYRPHPHALVGKNCANGIYQINFITDSKEPTIVSFSDLSIQCTKKKEIAKQLNERKHRERNFTGENQSEENCYRHDLQTIRLCFQVFIRPDPQNPNYEIQLKAKVSQPITNKTTATELKINDISDASSKATGGKKIMIFCSRVSKEDIQIRFFEESADKTEIWQDWGKLRNVHHKVGISFTTPKYALENIDSSRGVFIELVRPSDNWRSNRLAFQYVCDVPLNRKLYKVQRSQEILVSLSDLGAHGHNQGEIAAGNDWQHQSLPPPNQDSESKSVDSLVNNLSDNLMDKLLEMELQEQQQLHAQQPSPHQERENRTIEMTNFLEDLGEIVGPCAQFKQQPQVQQAQQFSPHLESENHFIEMRNNIKKLATNDVHCNLMDVFMASQKEKQLQKQQQQTQQQQFSRYQENQSVEMQSLKSG